MPKRCFEGKLQNPFLALNGKKSCTKVTSRFEVNSRNELNFWLPIKKREWHDFFVSKMKDRNEVAVQRDVFV